MRRTWVRWLLDVFLRFALTGLFTMVFTPSFIFESGLEARSASHICRSKIVDDLNFREIPRALCGEIFQTMIFSTVPA
jgi:hypothetical protein